MPAPWGDRHKALNRESHSDQIVAMFKDLTYFRGRYTGHLTQGKIEGTMTFPEYAYACHFKGPYKPEAYNVEPEVKQQVSDFHDKWLTLSLQIQ